MPNHTEETEARAAEIIARAAELLRTDARRGRELFEQALAVASDPERPAPLAQGDSLFGLCRASAALGENGQALVSGLEALAIFRSAGDLARQAPVLTRVGVLYRLLGDYASGLDYVLQSAEVAAQAGDRAAQSIAVVEAGIVLSEMGRPVDALRAYDEALELCRSLGRPHLEGHILNSYCVDSTVLGDYERALACGARSVELFEQTGDVYGQGVALGSIGEAYVAAGRFAEAAEALGRSLDLLGRRSADLRSYEALAVRYQIGLALLGAGDTAGGRAQLEQSLAAAEETGVAALAAQCHERLSELCEREGDPAAALAHYRRFHAAREQVYNEASDQKLKNFEVLHRTRQALREAERQRQLRDEDRRYFEQLAELQREFFNTATHDLKNPLSAVEMGVSLLETYLPAGEGDAKLVIGHIRTGVARMQSLIGDFLDLARLETGRALRVAPAPAGQILEAAVRDQRLAAGQKRQQIVLDADLGDLIVECDLRLVRRALDNLIGNAVKYTPPAGRITVSARAAGGLLTVTVADTGLGIPPAALPHLFDRFYRVQGERHMAQEGSGLGLAIVKSIVEQHGGRVWVESEPGRGSAFHLELPVAQPTAPAYAALSERA